MDFLECLIYAQYFLSNIIGVLLSSSQQIYIHICILTSLFIQRPILLRKNNLNRTVCLILIKPATYTLIICIEN